MESIYRENVMDHYKHPRNHGTLKNPDVTQKGFNPLCGDEVELCIIFDKNKVKKVSFDGKGCAISQAAASMLSEVIIGKTVAELREITKEDIFDMVGIQLSASRIKCALLAWDTLRQGLKGYNND